MCYSEFTSDLCTRCGARDSDIHTFWLCPANRHNTNKCTTSTNKLIQTAILGCDLLPCLWLRGIIPEPLTSVSEEYWPKADLQVHYTQYTENHNNMHVISGTYYGDASGGKFSSYPKLRRCGVGLVHINLDSTGKICREWGCSMNLIGQVQTVPRAELFALHFLLNEAPANSVLEFITDNLKECQTFNKGVEAGKLSANHDLLKLFSTTFWLKL